METSTLDWVSKTDLFAGLAAAGFQPSDDRLDRLRAAGLIDQFVPLPDCGPERFTTKAQAARIRLAYQIAADLRLKKPKVSEIAFWMAVAGYDVPPDLVAEHIEKSLEAFLSRMYRILTGRGVTIDLDYPILPRETKSLGQRIGKYLAARPVFKDSFIAQLAITALAQFSLEFLFRKESFSLVAPLVKRFLVFVLKDENQASLFARSFWDELCDALELIAPGDRNRLKRAVRECRESSPQRINPAVRDTALFVKVMSRVMPLFSDKSIGTNLLGMGDADWHFIKRYFLPTMSAALILTDEHPYATELRNAAHQGDLRQLESDMAQVATAGAIVLERISA